MIGKACYKACHKFCRNCTENYDNTKCSECEPGYYLYNTTCDITCPPRTFLNVTSGHCIDCFENCAACKGNKTTCTKCSSTTFMQPPSWVAPANDPMPEMRCREDCPVTFFGEVNSRVCEPCYVTCQVCTDPTNYCPICRHNAWMMRPPGQCLPKCPESYYGDLGDRTCKPCHSNCLECFGSKADNCITCADSTMWSDNGACKSCHPTCARCRGGTYKDCIACDKTSYLDNGECKKLDCPISFWPNLATGKCELCPGSCRKCHSPDECYECNKGFLLVGSQCVLCEKKRGFYTYNGDCEEYCGDGFNMGKNPCDDGNTEDGDGCSKTCQVEEGWICTGGNEFMPDSCYKASLVTATASGNLADDPPAITLKFSEPVTITSSWDKIIAVYSLPGQKLFTDFTVVQVDSRTFTILLENDNPKTKLQSFLIKDIKPSYIIDKNGQPIYFSPLTADVDFSSVMDDSRLTFGLGVATAAQAAATSTAVTLAVSGSANLMWKLIESIQAISFLVLLSVDFPPLVEKILDLLEFTQLSWLPNPSKALVSLFSLDIQSIEKESPEKFKESEIRSVFLMNSGQLLGTITFSYIIYVWIKYYQKKRKGKFLTKIANIFSSNTIIKMGINMYFLVLMGALLQIIRIDFRVPFLALSSVLAVVMLFILILTPAILLHFLVVHKEEINSKRFLVKYGGLVEEYKTNTFLARNYIVISTFSKMVFALSLVLLHQVPVMQTLGVLFSKVFKVCMLIYAKPYKSRRDYYLDLANEGFTAAILCFVVGIAAGANPKGGFFATGTSVLIISLLLVNIAVALVEQLQFYYELLKRVHQQFFVRTPPNIIELNMTKKSLAKSRKSSSTVYPINESQKAPTQLIKTKVHVRNSSTNKVLSNTNKKKNVLSKEAIMIKSKTISSRVLKPLKPKQPTNN